MDRFAVWARPDNGNKADRMATETAALRADKKRQDGVKRGCLDMVMVMGMVGIYSTVMSEATALRKFQKSANFAFNLYKSMV